MNSPAANSGRSPGPRPAPTPLSFFLVMPDGSCIPATPDTVQIVMRQARSEARKQAKIKRLEKAAELQCAIEDRAAAKRLQQELAELSRGSRRWAARFSIQVRPDKPETRTSPVDKRKIVRAARPNPRSSGTALPASSWAIDDRGMRGVIWQQSYLGRKSQGFHRGAARDRWEYDVRDEAVLLDAAGEPIIISNMGDDWVEIGAAWQMLEDASTRANAKIQFRVVAPFDSDMSQAEMIVALTHFCETVLAPLDLPYAAVVHRASDYGDERNVHAHLTFGLRPTRRIDAYSWEVADEVTSELDGRDGVQMLRHLWAHSMSEAAERTGSNRRYTGLGYGARGLDLEAGEHIGEARSAILARGGHVWAHERNRIKAARNAARRSLRDIEKKIAALTTIRDTVVARMERDPATVRPAKLLMATCPSNAAQRLASRPLPEKSGDRLTPSSQPALAESLAIGRLPRTDRRHVPVTAAPNTPEPKIAVATHRNYAPASRAPLVQKAAFVTVAAIPLRTGRPIPPTLVVSTHEIVATRPGAIASARRFASATFDPRGSALMLEIERAPVEAAITAWIAAARPSKRLAAHVPAADQIDIEDQITAMRDAIAQARRQAERQKKRRDDARRLVLSGVPELGAVPTLGDLPTHEALRQGGAVEPVAALDADDDRRLSRLAEIDAYVADYGVGRLDLDASALGAVGADDDWQRRPAVQTALAARRAEQQKVIADLAREANRRPLDFRRATERFWPRDLDAAALRRLDRWAEDPGFQHDVATIEQRIDAAYDARSRASRSIREADQTAAATDRIPDGFGSMRDTPPPVFHDHGPHARVDAFASGTDRPTNRLLMLLKLAAEHPRRIEFATDGKLMAISGTPPMLAALLHGWRSDERVAALVGATVRLSRDAGRPAWPQDVAVAMRAYLARGTDNSRPAKPQDLTRERDR